jgi:transposase
MYVFIDMPDHIWTELEPRLPGREGCWGGIAHDNRKFIDAVLWIMYTETPWRKLPEHYGNWANTHRRFCRWREGGIWEHVLEVLIKHGEYVWLLYRPSNYGIDKKKIQYPYPLLRMICRSDGFLKIASKSHPNLYIR